VDTPVPLSAKSFCSALLHKKDTAAIGANLKVSGFRLYFAKCYYGSQRKTHLTKEINDIEKLGYSRFH